MVDGSRNKANGRWQTFPLWIYGNGNNTITSNIDECAFSTFHLYFQGTVTKLYPFTSASVGGHGCGANWQHITNEDVFQTCMGVAVAVVVTAAATAVFTSHSSEIFSR